MQEEVPFLVEELYYHFSHELVPESWVGGFENNPVQIGRASCRERV